MKALKLFLLTLFAAFGLAVQAQTIEVYKDGQVIDTFSAAQVDSVVYKYAEPQARYYYYAGWECPTNETELANLAKAPNGGQFTSLTGLDTNKDYFSTELVNSTKAQWYLVIPTTLKAYDYIGGFLMTDDDVVMTKEKEIGNHTIWKSVASSTYVGGLKIY